MREREDEEGWEREKKGEQEVGDLTMVT